MSTWSTKASPNSRLSTSLPFLPTVRILTVLPSLASLSASARAILAMLLLKPPHSPRSAVITTSRWVRSSPVPRRSLGAPSPSPTEAASPAITLPNRDA